MSRPIIGISTYFVRASELSKNRARGQVDQDMLMSTMDYSRAVELAGGIPVTLPCYLDIESTREIVKRFDGFILAGGPDVDPMIYADHVAKGVTHVVPERDSFEFDLLDIIVKHDKPVLGICRGHQLMNVYFKGNLNQHDFVDQVSEISHSGKKVPRFAPRHKVRLKEDSLIRQIFNEETLDVNSYHHQVIDEVGQNLVATAWSSDGSVEAIEHINHKFVIGVQWHPEMMVFNHEKQLKVFTALVEASCNNL